MGWPSCTGPEALQDRLGAGPGRRPANARGGEVDARGAGPMEASWQRALGARQSDMELPPRPAGWTPPDHPPTAGHGRSGDEPATEPGRPVSRGAHRGSGGSAPRDAAPKDLTSAAPVASETAAAPVPWPLPMGWRNASFLPPPLPVADVLPPSATLLALARQPESLPQRWQLEVSNGQVLTPVVIHAERPTSAASVALPGWTLQVQLTEATTLAAAHQDRLAARLALGGIAVSSLHIRGACEGGVHESDDAVADRGAHGAAGGATDDPAGDADEADGHGIAPVRRH